MGKSHSKYRTSFGSQRTWGADLQPHSSWDEMEGPSFPCAYLGFTPVSKPPTHAGVLQNPIRELYYKYRRASQAGRGASLKLTQKGVLVILYEDGAFKAELFFEFSSVTFVETVRFSPVRTSSERKPKALFAPVDESRTVPEKNAFLIEKSFHFLISSNHPPLVVCVVRRPQGVKALDCHVFALDSVENALHISALIGSAQTGSDEHLRSRGGFERTQHGRDVIRTEYGEYSVYRGPQGGSSQTYDDRRSSILGYEERGHSMFGPPSGRSSQDHGVGGVTGSIILTQEDFHRSHTAPQHHPHQQPPLPQQQQQPPKSPYSPTEPPSSGHPHYMPNVIPGSAPQFRLPDLLDRSMESTPSGYDDHQAVLRNTPRGDSNYTSGNHRRSSGGSAGGGPAGGGPAGYHPADSGQRHSGGAYNPQSKVSPRPSDLPSPRYTSGAPFTPPRPESNPPPHPSYHPISPRTSDIASPRSPQGTVFSPTSPLGGGGGPVFSASNRESRADPDVVDSRAPEDPRFSGKPVAKVPPHLKAGIKVLPSDFRAVKLKPKAEKKTSESNDESQGYDNNPEIMSKYRELQERNGGTGDIPRDGHYPDGEVFRDFTSASRHTSGHEKEFSSHWSDSTRPSSHPYGETSGGGVKVQAYEGHRSSVGGDEPPGRMKDAEIAEMFSNFQLSSGARTDAQARQSQNTDFAQSLGYLP